MTGGIHLSIALGGDRVTTARLGQYQVSLSLKDIAETELRNEPLTEAQLDFMNQLVYENFGSGGPPYDGWYVRLLYNFTEDNRELFDPTIADLHTSPNDGAVLHVGVGYPSLMLISVQTDCQLRSYVGPVLSYHDLVRTGFERLDDNQWKEMLLAGESYRPDWTGAFVR
jgi:hypothetical protein